MRRACIPHCQCPTSLRPFRTRLKMLVVFVILLHFSHHASAVVLVEGDPFVLLHCEFETFELEEPTVVWSRKDFNPPTVHERQANADKLQDQNQHYSGRTSMKKNALESGDLTLNLTNPKVSDSGTYTCTVKAARIGRRQLTEIQLQVKPKDTTWANGLVALFLLLAVFGVVGGLLFYFRQYFMSDYKVQVESGVMSVQLPCKTTVRLPKNAKVQWTDSSKRTVHVKEDGEDQNGEQDWKYRGRTKMKIGDLSLTLKCPEEGDTDTYTCTVSSGETILVKKQVELNVKVLKVEENSGVKYVRLPFKTTVDLSKDIEVEWLDRNHSKVHVYRNNSDQPEEQDCFYGGRTKLDLLKTGDLSLTLMYPTDTDNHTYTCNISENGDTLIKKQVSLHVKACQVEVEKGEQLVQLPFKTTGDLPEDSTVEWETSEPEYMRVHVYQGGSDQSGEQADIYRGRTKMDQKPLKSGDLSLTLENPTDKDTGTYVCEVYSNNRNILRKKVVELKVKDKDHLKVNFSNRRDSTDPNPLIDYPNDESV
ncbi:butyrophilin-like protein 2 [Mugil cephalus]|uniref:butyrophilin-like protein 2 n=1 Tax=Mugil cephalus TaxID=48193 RepID=UPI001FB599B6|nr:butyrophilin-like protein 2 [Mugil cephalus]